MAATNDSRRRVKFYVLNDMRQWDDKGTGYVSWVLNDKQRSVSIIVKSEIDGSVLLDSKILVSIVYQKQQDTLIVWSDMDKRDMALSFQEKSGCDEIWEKICEVHGKDTSSRITSSRVSSDGTVLSGDNLDESDDDQIDGDINTSPSSDLPVCELNRLKDIRDFFVIELMRKSNPYKEKLTSILETENYIKRLIDLFHMCEDLENAEGLNYLFEIFRSLFYLNKSPLLDILLSDDLIMEVIGCLEYDPARSEPVRHREYISTKAQFKEVIPFDNVDLVNKIHQTYKVQYIQDVILPAPSVFEENSLATLNSFIFLNKVEIANLIQEDERFLNELFENLKNTELEVVKRRDMFLFLREYISFLHGLQQAREPLYQSLYNHGILFVVEIALTVKDEKVNTTAIEIFSQFVEVVPTLVREFILKEVESRSSISNLKFSSKQTYPVLCTPNASFNGSFSVNTVSTTPTLSIALEKEATCSGEAATSSTQPSTSMAQLSPGANADKEEKETLPLYAILNIDEDFEPVLINFVIRQMINDPDQELSGALQIINLLKLLIDPENMLSGKYVEKSEFLAYFYKKSMCVLLSPLMANTTGGRIHREDYRIAQLENLILDFLSFCVERHTYHIKNYIMHKDLLKRILVLLRSKHQFLALSALRFLRKTLSLKEETYNKYIIKSNLFEAVVEALKSNGSRYNILNSAIIELFDFIRSEDIKSLMNYVIENFYSDLETFNYVRTFKDLKLRYDQNKERPVSQDSRSRLSNDGTPALYRTRTSSDRYRSQSERIDFDKDDEAWIQEDENEIEARIDAGSLSGSVHVEGNYILASSFSSSSSSSSGSSSNSSTNNNNMSNENSVDNAENTNIDSYLEFKKSSPVEDENEDTVFSPVKSVTSPNSNTNNAFKSINIKISAATAMALNKKKGPEEEELQVEGGSDSDQSQSPKSVGSSNSPSTKKHSLVDYDSDDDEENDQNKVNNENEEPMAKRPATDSNTYFKETSSEPTAKKISEPNVEKATEDEEDTESYGPTPEEQSDKMSVDVEENIEPTDAEVRKEVESSELVTSKANADEVSQVNSGLSREKDESTEMAEEDLNTNSSITEPVNNIHNNQNEISNSTTSAPSTEVTTTQEKTETNSVEPDTVPPPTTNGYHHQNESHTSQHQNNTKYELNEATVETTANLFLNISSKMASKSSALDVTNEPIITNDTLTSSTSPVSLTSLEPANKRARLSNS